MEKKRVTVTVGGQRCSFYSDDSEEYISELEERANSALKGTARFSGSSASMNAILAIISLTDALMRAESMKAEPPKAQQENKRTKKDPLHASEQDKSQVSVWEILDNPAELY